MRPRQLIYAATGLLIFCGVMIIGQSLDGGKNRLTTVADTHPDPLIAKPTGSHFGSPRDVAATASQPARGIPNMGGTAMPKNPAAKSGPVANVARPTNSNVTAGSIQGSPIAKNPDASAGEDAVPQLATFPQPEPGSPPKGIQLAETVKLPAVILAINATERDPQSKIPAPVAAAMHGIVDTFYRDLAESATKVPAVVRSNGSGAATGTEDTGAQTGTEDTIVIHPGPSVEEARERANETYRALFGDAAYDQMTMRAMMEVNLPASPATGGD